LKKPRLILGTKTDLEESSGRLEELREIYPREKVRGISVFSGQGLAELAGDLAGLADAAGDAGAEAVAAGLAGEDDAGETETEAGELAAETAALAVPGEPDR
jgi:hypothetical protein